MAPKRPDWSAIRYPLMALGAVSLLLALWAGLIRIGWSWPTPRSNLAALHGPLMVFGFLGTLIGLERAVALRRPWGFAAPAASLAGSALLLFGVREEVGQAFLVAAGAVLAALFLVILRAHATASAAALLGSAVLWIGGALLWALDASYVEAVPWWAGFLVLTIVGERLELAALGRLTGGGRAAFALATALLLAGLTTSVWATATGIRIAGAALIGFALWLLRYDVARQTVRRGALPRFIAVALLAGYVWLGVAGALWARSGAVAFGPDHDALLHALFLGFVISMVFAHAPVILPGVLRVAIPFRRVFYVHLALLHVTLAIRIAGDLAVSSEAERWGGLLNAVAIVLFLAVTAGTALHARLARRERGGGEPAPARSGAASSGK